MLTHFVRFLLIVALFIGTGAVLRGEPSPERVVVVANSSDPLSMGIAEYYMEQRAIPERNLILLETSTKEAITWDEFVDTIFNPLREQLIDKGWLIGSLSQQKDNEGRIAAAVMGHEIDFLVVCHLPLRLKHDAERLAHIDPATIRKEFYTNAAAVDAELCLLAVTSADAVGFLPNPLFHVEQPPMMVRQSVVRVARLDGGSFESAKRSIDSGLIAERDGLRGLGYIDLSNKHPDGNAWLEDAGKTIESLNYPVNWNKDDAQQDWKERFDGAAFYFGWYGKIQDSPIYNPAFCFAPGAVAFHLHSFSAATLRNPHDRWVAPLLDRGAAVSFGNVHEPFLKLTHRPDYFMEGLSKGMSAGEAAYYALPILSWQAVFVGDPLYQPFKVDLATQLERVKTAPDELSEYVVLRKMKEIRAGKDYEEAFAYGVDNYKQVGGLALAYHLAQQYKLRGGQRKALELLQPWCEGDVDYTVSQWGLLFETGLFLESIREEELALQVYENLIRLAEGDRLALFEYYPAAIEEAYKLNMNDQASAWQATLTDLRVTEEEQNIKQRTGQ